MNKIEELIEKFCPEGVEYKTLEELGEFYSGLSGKSKSDFTNGNAKFATYMNIYSNPSFDVNIEDRVKVSADENQNKIEYGDILFTGSSETPDECGMSSVVTNKINEPIYLNSFCFGFRFNEPNKYVPDYMKHIFRCNNLRNQIAKTASGVTRFNVSKERFKKVSIPVPPLPIQEAIVKILDNFSSLTAELQAELQARKSQYEFYRNKLLAFDREDADTSSLQSDVSSSSLQNGNNPNTQNTQGNCRVTTTIRKPRKVKWMRLGDACFLKSGKGIPASEINDTKDNINRFECYGANGLRGYVNHYSNDGFFPIIGRQGALCGNVCFASGKFYATEHAVLVSNKENFNSRFLFHLLTKMDLNQYKSQGAQPGLSVEKLNELSIPIPSIEEQGRIANILDHFDALINDISTGLPAEIAARQQQYEYYRDKLLTFKRKEA
jgi:type I restriction enzyme S subunit